AYRFKLPAIVPLIVIGSLLGYFKILDPEQFGEGFHTVVQLGVAIILFEGGLRLKVKQFKEAPRVIRNLVSIGVLITWMLSALSAYYLIPALNNQSGFEISLLFGALVTVSGPTVIIPLLKVVKPNKKITTVLKWEGILIDPIGALLAVVLLTFLINAGSSSVDSIVKSFLSSLSIGLVFGAIAAFIIYRLLKYEKLIPEEMRNLVVLTMVFVVFSLSNWMQPETGILSVTVMGFALGILNPDGLREIESFKGQLTTLMVSILFILLAASLDIEAIWYLGLPGLFVLLVVLLVIRPLNVFLCSIGSQLNLREKTFVSWISPRGIVAAAVASLFASTLSAIPEYSYQAGYIESLTFLIIGGSVFFQGATARMVGKLLKVIEPDPNGVIIIGANMPARQLAKLLIEENVDVILLDSNNALISKAKKENIPAEAANAIAQQTIDDFQITGYGKLLAFTPNEKVNILACQLWAQEFGKDNVYRINVGEEEFLPSDQTKLSGEGHVVFSQDITQQWLQTHLGTSWIIDKQEIKSKEQIQQVYEDIENNEIYPLAIIDNSMISFYSQNIEINEDIRLLFLKKVQKKIAAKKKQAKSKET
ncbi:MAG TPA: hypothetical protein ENO18_06455, partial [Caldithrix sp.]|nr:hypothetical protein [Caldithrix sp.]